MCRGVGVGHPRPCPHLCLHICEKMGVWISSPPRKMRSQHHRFREHGAFPQLGEADEEWCAMEGTWARQSHANCQPGRCTVPRVSKDLLLGTGVMVRITWGKTLKCECTGITAPVQIKVQVLSEVPVQSLLPPEGVLKVQSSAREGLLQRGWEWEGRSAELSLSVFPLKLTPSTFNVSTSSWSKLLKKRRHLICF